MDNLSPIDEERQTKVRQKLSTMSFEDLLQLKKTIGTKLLNESVLGTPTKKLNKSFKRANKNRPREMSSKTKVLSRTTNVSVARSQPRDPRFDSLCGAYDDKIFKNNYKFVFNIKMKEITQLQNEFRNEEDPERRNKIKKLIQRLQNQIREHRQQEEESKEDKETTRGIKPVFKKKSEERLERVVEKYAKLKNSNSMKKYMERKSKKIKKKEKKINLQNHN